MAQNTATRTRDAYCPRVGFPLGPCAAMGISTQGMDTQAGIRLVFWVVIFDLPALKNVPPSMIARKMLG